jgi:ATP-dependent DNA helicase RecG
MPHTYKVFISSVQRELAAERRAVKENILHDPVLGLFFKDVFLFEDIPAKDQAPDDIYLHEVDRRDIYIGILGNEYGRKNADGLSATEMEFIRATEAHRERLIFIAKDGSKREPEMAAMIRRIDRQLTRQSFFDIPSLVREVYASLVGFLRERKDIRTTPFDATDCDGSKLSDIDAKQIDLFLENAKSRGRLHLRGGKSTKSVLQHFNLVSDGIPTNAAMLLFGRDPFRFLPNAQVQCLHFRGTEKRKPILSQQPYMGSAFDVIDRAVDFTMERLVRHVGLASGGAAAPVAYEVPERVVREAIVNAVAHRDYDSHGFVQAIVFSNRIEIWNPGELPSGITIEMLRKPHPPIPRNPLIAEPIFRAGYAEKAGSGITDMISDCLEAGLPEPDFVQHGPHFVVTLWRDWLTDQRLAEFGLNDRQLKAVMFVKERGKITNQDYQKLLSVSKPTATRDLEELLKKGALEKVGTTGRGTHYRLGKKGS